MRVLPTKPSLRDKSLSIFLPTLTWVCQAGCWGTITGRTPCGFCTIHFGGLKEKPSDAMALWLADDILRPQGE